MGLVSLGLHLSTDLRFHLNTALAHGGCACGLWRWDKEKVERSWTERGGTRKGGDGKWWRPWEAHGEGHEVVGVGSAEQEREV